MNVRYNESVSDIFLTRKDSMSHQNFRTAQSSHYPRCVDGRAAEVFILWDGESWIVDSRGDEARSENGPQFLGAALLFVKALEELAGKSRDEAFDLVEAAAKETNMGLQVHLDDGHGQHDFAAMSDEEILELMNAHHSGCGFAKYAWGEDGDAVIQEAKRRHWRLQLLVGEHQEMGATSNYLEGTTFDTAPAVEEGQSQFNTDLAEARKVFIKLGEMIEDDSFAQRALDWTEETYTDVVIALKGVETADEVLVLK